MQVRKWLTMQIWSGQWCRGLAPLQISPHLSPSQSAGAKVTATESSTTHGHHGASTSGLAVSAIGYVVPSMIHIKTHSLMSASNKPSRTPAHMAFPPHFHPPLRRIHSRNCTPDFISARSKRKDICVSCTFITRREDRHRAEARMAPGEYYTSALGVEPR